jgi:hypothetical protein
MKHTSLLTLLLAVLGAAQAQSAGPDSAEEAAQQAEAFVLRHGFTAAGHPMDQPVENVSLFDMLSSRKDLVAHRRGSLEAHATCVRPHAKGFSVLFRSTHEKDRYLFVALEPGERPYVGHQSVPMSEDCKPVPSPVP